MPGCGNIRDLLDWGFLTAQAVVGEGTVGIGTISHVVCLVTKSKNSDFHDFKDIKRFEV
jgi:hypothetical protein